tara:strand:- start:600 stop:1475 length:876 start_codon:yes stop_codon:yes gene_type:complete
MPSSTIVITPSGRRGDNVANIQLLEDAIKAEAENAEDCFFVGMDLEGIDLGRHPGTLEVISLSVGREPLHSFVIDAKMFEDADENGARLLDILERMLGHEHCVTVFHDCRRDCDALHHHLNLMPVNVHDTSIGHWVLMGKENTNLNNTLEAWGVPINKSRGRINYRDNPGYWGQRPLTGEMVLYAKGDVDSLVPMALKQLSSIANEADEQRIREMSQTYRDCLVGMEFEWLECQMPMRMFIGSCGRNIRATEKRTGCFFYQSGTSHQRENGFWVYYPSSDGLRRAKKAMGY